MGDNSKLLVDTVREENKTRCHTSPEMKQGYKYVMNICGK